MKKWFEIEYRTAEMVETDAFDSLELATLASFTTCAESLQVALDRFWSTMSGQMVFVENVRELNVQEQKV